MRLVHCAVVGALLFLTSAIEAQQRVVASVGLAPRTETASLSHVLKAPITISIHKQSMQEAVNAVIQQAGVRVLYQTEVFAGISTPVSLDVSKQSLGEVFALLFAGTSLRAVPVGPDCIAIETDARRIVVADGTIIGRVVHEKTKQPISGATVTVQGIDRAISTDADGRFRLALPSGDYTLQIKAIGFVRNTETVTVTENEERSIEVVLSPSASVLDEVIVTGTVVATERKAIPTPITVITGEEIMKRGITRVEELFRGEVPGVLVLDEGSTRYGTDLGAMASSKIYARGSSTLTGGANPLKTYIDGVEILDPSLLGTIDPHSIERIEIITGPQAATIYGSGAMGGVMQIFTRNGTSQRAPDIMLNMRYGVLESNLSNGKTPVHVHSINASGGVGQEFSYAGTVSYNYSGQWLPGLFSRRTGMSAGVRHARGNFSVNGKVSVSAGKNGTAPRIAAVGQMARHENGDFELMDPSPGYSNLSRKIGTSGSQTFSLEMNYTYRNVWQHQFSAGRNATELGMIPRAPDFATPVDTLFEMTTSTGARTTVSYSTTYMPSNFGWMSSVLTLGANGAQGSQTRVTGCLINSSSSSYAGCLGDPGPTAQRALRNESWGGFGQWRVGVADRLYVTLGLRGERNPSYGREHKIDWTPNNGITFVFESALATVKLMGSYGRATRPPNEDLRREKLYSSSLYDPSTWISQAANPLLRPEYSRGPQGGVEIYLASVASLSINHFSQRVTDLIEAVHVDSVVLKELIYGGESYTWTTQYQNVAVMKQKGWEGTASINLGPMSLRGTYSWSDSRITRRENEASRYIIGAGQAFWDVPTHTGSFTLGYAHGKTNVSSTTNYVGSSIHENHYGKDLYQGVFSSRLPMYWPLGRLRIGYGFFPGWRSPGYVKTNLVASHVVSPRVTLTMNINNIGDRYNSDVGEWKPSLGRQTTFGAMIRFP